MSVGNFRAFLDDWSIFSDQDTHLIKALGECMERCRKAGLALNPKKCRFMVPQGKLLGHFVCKEGPKTDPDKIGVIVNMENSTNVTWVKSFSGHVGYYWRFIKGFAQVSWPLDKLTRKGEPFVLGMEQEGAFKELKDRLVSAPILVYPDWNKEFHVHVDASNFAIGATLAQVGTQGLDHSVFFASQSLSMAERNYNTTEMEALGMVYAVQKFRHYLLATLFTFYVDHQTLMYLVNKSIIQGREISWLLLLQGFTFTIIVRPSKSHVIVDQLSRISSGEPAEGVNEDFRDALLFQIAVLQSWYEKIGQYLSTSTFPNEMSSGERWKLALKSKTFRLINGLLCKMGFDQILRRCVMEEIPSVLKEAHDGLAGEHMGPNATARKVLLAGLWWPTLHTDAREWLVGCDNYQCAGKPLKRDFMPLFPSQPQELFERWGLDFVGPLKPSSMHRCNYIVVATEYLTKWAEARAVPDNTALSMTQFLYEQIVTRYEIPLQITSDKGAHFVNQVIHTMTVEIKIFHNLSSPYYPRANRQAKATNKVLVSIIYKSCGVEQED